MSRPEEVAPPDLFYNETEAAKYLQSSRMIEIQAQMAERAVEMLCLPEDGSPCIVLDIGCGTGLSGETLEELGHSWVGVDISRDMLRVAKFREVEGDLLEGDMGHGLPFRQGCFDGAISISAIQWLCYSDRHAYDPRKRLVVFFQSLYKCLRRGARAALQFYPKDADQLQLITASAMRAGFGGGVVIDFPNSSKAKKCDPSAYFKSCTSHCAHPRHGSLLRQAGSSARPRRQQPQFALRRCLGAVRCDPLSARILPTCSRHVQPPNLPFQVLSRPSRRATRPGLLDAPGAGRGGRGGGEQPGQGIHPKRGSPATRTAKEAPTGRQQTARWHQDP